MKKSGRLKSGGLCADESKAMLLLKFLFHQQICSDYGRAWSFQKICLAGSGFFCDKSSSGNGRKPKRIKANHTRMKFNHQFQIPEASSLLLAVTFFAGSNTTFGLGFAIPDQDAFATARGNAFVATADDPAAVYYNPAGISQLDGTHLSVGAYGLDYGSTYKNDGNTIKSKNELAVLPQVFSTWSLPKYNLTLGLGTYSPYGLRNSWPSAAPFSGASEMGEMDYFTLNPVVAYQILPTLSLAAGPTLNFSEVDIKETPGPYIVHFRGRDTAAGFNAGLLWHPWEQHSFGITYRSATDMNYNGHGSEGVEPVNIPSQANIHFPQVVAFGYSYRPTTNWNFEADANWTDWTDLRDVNVNPQVSMGVPETIGFNWHPSWMLDFGATRYLGNGWRLSAGYMFSENTVPEADFSAMAPDSNRYIFSLGLGKSYKCFSWDVAYQLGWGPSHYIGAANDPAFNGTYAFFSNAIGINFGYHF
jgi:long-chain fatty acid transport protein